VTDPGQAGQGRLSGLLFNVAGRHNLAESSELTSCSVYRGVADTALGEAAPAQSASEVVAQAGNGEVNLPVSR
jgi:hypothetical protein